MSSRTARIYHERQGRPQHYCQGRWVDGWKERCEEDEHIVKLKRNQRYAPDWVKDDR